jgi:hypothetical protein
MRSIAGLDSDPIINRVLKTLLTAKVSLGRLDGDVPQQKLNQVQLPSSLAAQAGAGSTQVMRGQVRDGGSLGAILDDMPHNPLRYTDPPGLS